MTTQLSEGKQLAIKGMEQAKSTADKDFPQWSDRCWNLFERWLGKKEIGFEFQIEDFRSDCYKWNKIEKPRTDRAFGFISVRAVKMGMIVFLRNEKVNNSKAHATPAGVWRKK